MDKEKDHSSLWNLFGAGGGTPTDAANNKHLTIWSFAWGLSIVVASWLITMVELPTLVDWILALAPNVLAVVVLRSYLRFLRMTDELQRKIQIEGLAMGFGAGYLFAICYLVAQAAGAPPLNVAFLIMLMTAGWLIGNVVAMRHYR